MENQLKEIITKVNEEGHLYEDAIKDAMERQRFLQSQQAHWELLKIFLFRWLELQDRLRMPLIKRLS